MNDSHWIMGDTFGLQIPSDATALEQGGAEFLTRAFRANGILASDDRVSTLTRCEPCFGGGTGSKLLLSVDYPDSRPDLDNELFVKFSRNHEDEIRDSVRYMLAPEIRFAQLSCRDDFPITVPRCYFADMHRESGTGLLITRRIPYGQQGIEQQHIKCMDHLLDNPLDHYRTLIRSLGKLAGSFKANRLADGFYRDFPFDPEKAMAEDPLRYRDTKLNNRLSRLAEFIDRHPHLFPDNIRSSGFVHGFTRDVPRFVAADGAIRRYLYNDPDLIALCHWNANIDNAWFWRDESGELECGLMDWGMVNQMNLGGALWGALSAAETDMWNRHLDSLLRLFADQFHRAGGPALEPERLRAHLVIIAILLGLSWLMDAPALIRREIPELSDVPDRFAPAFRHNETARAQLQMMTNLMNLWQRHDVLGIAQGLVNRTL